MRTPLTAAVILWGLFGLAAALPAQEEKSPDELILKGPGGQEFVFCAIPLELEGDRLASRRYVMGDPALGFRAHPTAVALGGSFLRPLKSDPEQEEWIYYLSKYEVTEAQYYAVMGLPESLDQEALQSRKPMAGLSWFEAWAFIDRLNQWLFAHALDDLPAFGEAPGYLRLPTEAEWEFAARGGLAVSADVFSQSFPYAEGLVAHEWFSGPKSSHNKVQEVGKLKPNPLGLHDMLGNVSEMTGSLYQLEYYQGRSGGFVARGGHFFSNEKDLSAALRTEEHFYTHDAKRGPQPNKRPMMGFRLALGSPIMTDREEIYALEDAWDEYRENAGAALPAAVSTAPVTVQTDLKAGEARDYMASLSRRLEAAGLPADALAAARQELGFIEASLGDLEVIRKQADDESALSWVRMGNLFGRHYVREEEKLQKLIPLLDMFADDEESENGRALRRRREEIAANLTEALTNYFEALTQMGRIAPASVQLALSRHRNYLAERQPGSAADLLVLDIFSKHYEAYQLNRSADTETWRRDFHDLALLMSEQSTVD